MIGGAIANYRYVVQGRDERGRTWAILATDSLSEAETALADGVMVNGKPWAGVRIWDRRVQIMPPKGWSDVTGAKA